MVEVKRTVVSQAALDLSELINMRFQARTVGTATPRTLRVMPPDGVSSDGGKKARQSVVLAPAGEGAGASVMIGWLDIAQRRAELRIHAVVKAQYEERHHEPFDVPDAAYDAVVTEVQRLLAMQSIDVVMVRSMPRAPDARATTAPEPAERRSLVPLLLGAGVLVIGLVVAALVLRHAG